MVLPFVVPTLSREAGEVVEAMREVIGWMDSCGSEVFEGTPKITRFHTDRAREFEAGPVEELARQHGISMTETGGHNSEGNGQAEVQIRTVRSMVRRVLLSSGFDHLFWPFAGRYVADVLRLSMLHRLGDKVKEIPPPMGTWVAVRRQGKPKEFGAWESRGLVGKLLYMDSADRRAYAWTDGEIIYGWSPRPVRLDGVAGPPPEWRRELEEGGWKEVDLGSGGKAWWDQKDKLSLIPPVMFEKVGTVEPPGASEDSGVPDVPLSSVAEAPLGHDAHDNSDAFTSECAAQGPVNCQNLEDSDQGWVPGCGRGSLGRGGDPGCGHANSELRSEQTCLVELCCYSDSLLSTCFEEDGHTVFRVGLPAFDLAVRKTCKVVQKHVMTLLETHKQMLIWVSVPCSPWSSLQRLNLAQGHTDTVEKSRREGLVLIKNVIGILRVVMRDRRVAVIWEWPRYNEGWHLEEIQGLLSMLPFGCALDGCAYGLQGTVKGEHGYFKKPWLLRSNVDISCLSRRCPEDHDHIALEGGPHVEASSRYTPELVRSVRGWWQGVVLGRGMHRTCLQDVPLCSADIDAGLTLATLADACSIVAYASNSKQLRVSFSDPVVEETVHFEVFTPMIPLTRNNRKRARARKNTSTGFAVDLEVSEDTSGDSWFPLDLCRWCDSSALRACSLDPEFYGDDGDVSQGLGLDEELALAASQDPPQSALKPPVPRPNAKQMARKRREQQALGSLDDLENVGLSKSTPVSVQAVSKAVGSERKGWEASMRKELTSTNDNRVYESLTSNQLGGKKYDIVPARMVFVLKPDPESPGGLKRKSRLVVCGNFLSRYAEYDVGNLDAGCMRLLLAETNRRGWGLSSIDVSTAFLNADIEEGRIVVVRPPDILKRYGLVGEGEFWKLDRALYGLKEAPALWQEERDRTLRELRFSVPGHGKCRLWSFISHPSLWAVVSEAEHDRLARERAKGENGVEALASMTQDEVAEMLSTPSPMNPLGFVAVYVDDFLFSCGRDVLRPIVKAVCSPWKTSEPKFLGEDGCTSITYLGMVLELTKGGLVAHQSNYTTDLLERFDDLMGGGRGSDVPAVSEVTPSKPFDLKTLQAVNGALLWLATRTRPDIAFAVSKLASCIVSDPEEATSRARRLLQYLSRTSDFGLDFGAVGKDTDIQAYSDISFAPDGKHSHSAVVLFYSGMAVTWRSHKQSLVCQSTAESELLAISDSMSVARACRLVLWEMGVSVPKCLLWCDSQPAIALVTGMPPMRTRLFSIRAWAINEAVSRGEVDVKYINTKDQKADMLTKPMTRELHNLSRKALGMKELI